MTTMLTNGEILKAKCRSSCQDRGKVVLEVKVGSKCALDLDMDEIVTETTVAGRGSAFAMKDSAPVNRDEYDGGYRVGCHMSMRSIYMALMIRKVPAC